MEAAPAPAPGLTVPARLTQADLDVVLLAQERRAHLVTDDRPARAFAESLGLNPEFTGEVVLACKLLEFIPSCKEVLDRMPTQCFGVEARLVLTILRAAGEHP